MQKYFINATLYTLVTAIILGLGYPLVITGLARILFSAKAAGSLIYSEKHELIGSALIGQQFTSPTHFHSRPSAAGNGYDAGNSGGSNLGPTNKALIDRVRASLASEGENAPVDLITASGSGLDPDISPAAAYFQVVRLASTTKLSQEDLRSMIIRHTTPRQAGVLGEPRVNVLRLNLDLDARVKSLASSPKTLTAPPQNAP